MENDQRNATVNWWIKRMFFGLGFGVVATLFLQMGHVTIPSFVSHDRVAENKKKIIIFSVEGGSGSTMAANALTDLVKDKYEVKIVNLYSTILAKFDPIYRWTGGKYSGVQFYNHMLAGDWTRMTNFYAFWFGAVGFGWNRRAMAKLINEYLVAEHADMVISVIPFGNASINDATMQLDMPFMLVTLDTDLSMWSCDTKRIKRDDFVATVGYDLPGTRKMLESKGLQPYQIKTIGFPMRERFFADKSQAGLRKKWNIPEDKFTIFLLMGGAGSRGSFLFTRELLKMNLPIHVLVCVGRNEAVKKQIEDLRLPNQEVTFTTIGFTEDINELMAVSDLAITKKGPGTINEAVKMKLPMILDNIAPALIWERPNLKFVKKNGFGVTIQRLEKLESLVTPFVIDKEYYQGFKKRLSEFKFPDYRQPMRHLIDSFFVQPHHHHDSRNASKALVLGKEADAFAGDEQ